MRVSDGELDELRLKADSIADDCVSELFAAGQMGEVNRLLDHLGAADAARSPLPAALETYLEQSSRLPADFDRQRFERAQEAFVLHGPTLGVALMYASLPTLYAGANGGVQLLAMTGQLQNHYRRRASVTLRFILDVMEPGSFEPGGPGLRAVQRVRLTHATVRFFARTSGRWAALPQWGAPLNQEELLGTLLAFSVVAIDNSATLSAPLTHRQAEDLLYAWQVVGELLGIERRGFPGSMQEARALWKRIGERNFFPTPEGQRLARDHIEFLDELVPTKFLDSGNLALSRWLMGSYVAQDCLRLPRPALWTEALRLLRPAIRLADCLLESRSPLRLVAEKIHIELMESLDRWWSDGKSPQFRVPTRIGPDGTSSEDTQLGEGQS